MIARPHNYTNKRRRIGAVAPVDPTNLTAAVGYDLFLPAGSQACIKVYPQASINSTTTYGVCGIGSANAIDLDLLVTGVVQDENGNPWFQCTDTSGTLSTGVGSSVFVPAIPASVPPLDMATTTATNVLQTAPPGSGSPQSPATVAPITPGTTANATSTTGGGIGWLSAPSVLPSLTNFEFGTGMLLLLILGGVILVESNNNN